MFHHELLQRGERFLHGGRHGREQFQHLFRVGHAAPDGEAERLWPDEQQVEQRFLRVDGAGEGRGHGHGFFKHGPVLRSDKRVEDERVPDEKFVLKFLHHRTPHLGPTAPVNAAQRVARTIVAQ